MTHTVPPTTGSRTRGGAVRPRYGRITAFGTASLVCGVAFLGGVGVLPDGGAPAQAADRSRSSGTAVLSGASGAAEESNSASSTSHARPYPGVAGESEPTPLGSRPLPVVDDDASTAASDPAEHPVPAGSGTGRRVVFDLEQQRVWLVRANGTVRRTYLASGSVTDNLRPGTYEVFSHSEDATGIDGTSMRWMVRFTRGRNAAIGFHDIPLGDDGRPVQRVRDLGTPTSHGCIRQAPGDARVLWRFAPVGTTVVVTG